MQIKKNFIRGDEPVIFGFQNALQNRAFARLLRYYCVGIVSLRYRFVFKNERSVHEIEILIPIIRDTGSNFTLALNYDKTLVLQSVLSTRLMI